MKNLKWMTAALVLQLLVLTGTELQAQPVMDGTADGLYGAALSIQDTNTQFGDNSSPDPLATATGGSEIDQVFMTVANDGTEDRLYVTITGNLETNFNKLEVFIDSVSGVGQNEIIGSALPVGVDAFCCGGIGTTDGALQRQDFLKFDAGFDADFYLTFSNGSENIGGVNFYAVSAHYAELNNGPSGRVVAAGLQLAPYGQHTPLRGPLPPDFDSDFDVDGPDFLTWQQGFGVGTTKPEGDANGDGVVDAADLSNPSPPAELRDQTWTERYGDTQQFFDYSFVPTADGFSTTSLQTAGSLPGISQGELIDRNYALSQTGGCTAATDDGGAGCITPELEFVLPVDSNDPDNTLNHRDFNNEVDLQLGFDNSNIAGVGGGDGTGEVTGDPENVLTGLEFSIPLDEIGLSASGFSGDIKLLAYINGTGHDFVSNQFSGDGVNTGNYGTLPPDLSTEADGDQFVTLTVPPPSSASAAVPEPTTALLLVSGALGFLLRRQS